jgi:hypothetical protein
MTKDDIIKLAQKAGMPMAWISDSGVLKWTDLERFANLVAEHEREECANLCEQWNASHPNALAAAIRARGNT